MGVAIFLYVLWWVGTTQVLNVLRDVSLTYFLGATLLMGVSYAIKFLRWTILVRGRHKAITNHQLFVVFAVNYGLSVSLPSKTGDVAGLEVSRRFAGIPVGDAVSFLAFYTVYDIGIILVMAAVSSLSIANLGMDWIKPVLTVCTILFTFLFILFLIPSTSEKMAELVLRVTDWCFSGRATPLRQSIHAILDDYLGTVREYSERKSVLIAVAGLTGIRWALEFFAFKLVLSSVGIEVGFGISVALVSLRVITSVLTLVPLGLGTSLIPTLAIFTILDVSKAAGVAVDVLSNLLGPISTAVIGLVCTSYLREHNSSSYRPD